MASFTIEQLIKTPAILSVNFDKNSISSFEIDGITFSHFNLGDPLSGDDYFEYSILAKTTIEAKSWNSVFSDFQKKLDTIIPIFSLTTHSYVNQNFEPCLVYEDNSNKAYFLYSKDRLVIGNSFKKEQEKALLDLLGNKNISPVFYKYWNDALNSIGYTSKLLLMFSAIEELFKKREFKNKEDYFNKIENVFGKELKEKLYGIKGNSFTGLRHRLAHGEYFDLNNDGVGVVDEIHEKVICYLNKEIIKDGSIEFTKDKIHINLYGNKLFWMALIEKNNEANFNMKEVLNSLEMLLGDKIENNFKEESPYKIIKYIKIPI